VAPTRRLVRTEDRPPDLGSGRSMFGAPESRASADGAGRRAESKGRLSTDAVVMWSRPAEGVPVVPAERKTGLYLPNVETTRLVRNERGWLRLAS